MQMWTSLYKAETFSKAICRGKGRNGPHLLAGITLTFEPFYLHFSLPSRWGCCLTVQLRVSLPRSL